MPKIIPISVQKRIHKIGAVNIREVLDFQWVQRQMLNGVEIIGEERLVFRRRYMHVRRRQSCAGAGSLRKGLLHDAFRVITAVALRAAGSLL